MTFREVLVRIVQNGRFVVQTAKIKTKKVFAGNKSSNTVKYESETARQEAENRDVRSSSIGRQVESKYFKSLIQVNHQSKWKSALRERIAEIRRKSALGFTPGVVGKGALGFTAVSFGARQYGTIEKDPQDVICEEMQSMFCRESKDQEVDQNVYSLEDFEFGKLISKGCNAAVYEARMKRTEDDSNGNIGLNIIPGLLKEKLNNSVIHEEPLHFDDQHFSMESDDESFEILDNSSNSSSQTQSVSSDPFDLNLTFDLAIKVMFNYDAESNATAIIQAMEKETVPAKQADNFMNMDTWQNGTHVRKKLPPHPNIVDMRLVFVDTMPLLSSAIEEYPDALPQRINSNGCGRNMTMFIVMKRYPETLRAYLQHESPSARMSSLLLAQLLEAVTHLNVHRVAHRDLKTDNILLDFNYADCPNLVVTDFGCCLNEGCMRISYSSNEVSKGGNAALMAPEINTSKPGLNSVLDFTKSDVWSVGTLAYELFGMSNPFYRSKAGYRLDSRNYREDDLLTLPNHVPWFVRKVITCILKRNPKERPMSSVAVNMLYLGMWAPTSFLHGSPSKADIVMWLAQLTLEVKGQRLRQSQPTMEMALKRMFLSRVKLQVVLQASLLLNSAV